MTTERSFEFCPSFISEGSYPQIFAHPVTRLPNGTQLVARIAKSRHPRGFGAMTSMSNSAKTTVDED